MIRVIHSQTKQGPLNLVDVDDGMPRKEFAYLHKQQTYVPYANPDDPTKAGYADLVESDKALLSADKGTIKGLVAAGDASVVSNFTPAQPVITSATLHPTGLQIVGTGLISTLPAVTVLNTAGTVESVVGGVPVFTGGVSIKSFTTLFATGLSVTASHLPAAFKVGATVAVKADSNVSAKATIV